MIRRLGLLVLIAAAFGVAVSPSQSPVRSTSSHPARAATALGSLASTDPLPADCVPNPIGPPSGPYQFGFVAEAGPEPGKPSYLEAGPNFDSLPSQPEVPSGVGQPVVEVNDITAKICGVATVVPGPPGCPVQVSITVPADGEKFGPLAAEITTIPNLTPQVPFTPQPQSLTSTVNCGTSVNGLVTSTVAVVGGSAGLFGLACQLNVTVQLTATVTGPLDPGDGSLSLQGEFIAKNFGLPAATPSVACPSGVVSNLDAIAGLPLAPGHAILVLPFVAAAYLPASS